MAPFSRIRESKAPGHSYYNAISELHQELADPEGMEGRMRMITEMMALTLQGALLTNHSPGAVAEAFCASRLAPRFRGAFGTLPKGCDLDAILGRAVPT